MHRLRSLAFPTLHESQIEEPGRCAGASLKRFQDGQTLFRVGERDLKFFVVKSGGVEIVDESDESPKTGRSRKVFLLVRGDDLYKSTSTYLTRRIEKSTNIEVLCNTTVRRMVGDRFCTRSR
ncbi:MAG TPA: hypothetical protein VIT00_00675 [Terrimicrobiaceae bacterium]